MDDINVSFDSDSVISDDIDDNLLPDADFDDKSASEAEETEEMDYIDLDGIFDAAEESPPIKKKIDERVVRDGNDRVTVPVINRFEFCNAVKHVAKQINKGAKVPKILEGTRYIKLTDTKLLAWYSVFFSLRHSLDEPLKNEKQRLECASVIIVRPVGLKFLEKWRLWELAYLETFPKNYKLNLEYTEKQMPDQSEIVISEKLNTRL